MRLSGFEVLGVVLVASIGCATPPPGGNGVEATEGVQADESAQAAPAQAAVDAERVLLSVYRVNADPVAGTWDLQPATGGASSRSPEGIGTAAGALANGDETVAITVGSEAGLRNCAAGQCGCNGGSPDFDVPTWYNNDGCGVGQRVAYGRVRLTNNTASSYFQNVAAVFVPRSPPSLRFFSNFPSAPFQCAAYSSQTRTSAPYSGNVYVRYNDLAAGACTKGVDPWVAAPTNSADFNARVSFDIYVYADALVPTQVPNGNFENGLSGWTLGGVGSALAEHCSHLNDYVCGGAEDGVLPPAGSGTMARLLSVDGAATPAYTGLLTSSSFQLQSGLPRASFRYKMGSREAAFCLAQNNDEFYVEARKNGGGWTSLPLSNPPDVDADSRVSTGPNNTHDCSVFNPINLTAVFEGAWYPSSPAQSWATATIDLTTAPLSAAAGDLIQLRFWIVSGTPYSQLGHSVLLLDDVQMVP